jgi:hypothetical protein
MLKKEFKRKDVQRARNLIMGNSGASTGTAELEGATIFWERDVDLGTIAIRITEIDGTVTTVTVPVGDFGF